MKGVPCFFLKDGLGTFGLEPFLRWWRNFSWSLLKGKSSYIILASFNFVKTLSKRDFVEKTQTLKFGQIAIWGMGLRRMICDVSSLEFQCRQSACHYWCSRGKWIANLPSGTITNWGLAFPEIAGKRSATRLPNSSRTENFKSAPAWLMTGCASPTNSLLACHNAPNCSLTYPGRWFNPRFPEVNSGGDTKLFYNLAFTSLWSKPFVARVWIMISDWFRSTTIRLALRSMTIKRPILLLDRQSQPFRLLERLRCICWEWFLPKMFAYNHSSYFPVSHAAYFLELFMSSLGQWGCIGMVMTVCSPLHPVWGWTESPSQKEGFL